MPNVEYLNSPVIPDLPPSKSSADFVQSSLVHTFVQGSDLYLYGAVIVIKSYIVTA